MRFGETKVAKEIFSVAEKNLVNIWYVICDNIIISKLIERKSNLGIWWHIQIKM